MAVFLQLFREKARSFSALVAVRFFKMVVVYKSRTLCIILAMTTASLAIRQPRAPSSAYHQETLFPSSNDFLRGSLTIDKRPVQVSAGFHLKPPPRFVLPFLPPLEPPRLDFLPRHDGLRERMRRPPLPPGPLFTPNTIEQTAETKGQVEAYEMALREEIEQDRATTEGHFTTDLEGTTQPTHFVSVKSREYNYNYSV